MWKLASLCLPAYLEECRVLTSNVLRGIEARHRDQGERSHLLCFFDCLELSARVAGGEPVRGKQSLPCPRSSAERTEAVSVKLTGMAQSALPAQPGLERSLQRSLSVLGFLFDVVPQSRMLIDQHFILFYGWRIFCHLYIPHFVFTFICWWAMGCLHL